MTGFTGRRRMTLSVCAGAVGGYFFLGWLARRLLNLAGYYVSGSASCDGTSTWANLFDGCVPTTLNPVLAWAELLAGCALAAAAVVGLRRWALRPLERMTQIVDRMGPSSTALRLGAAGADDEFGRLAQAIDGALDRISLGYEAQRRFAANASHELRTPLATQRALIEVSLARPLTTEQSELLTRQLLATNERSEALVDGLLALAEVERGVVARGPQRLDAVAADVLENLAPVAARKDVRIESRLDEVEVDGELVLLERLVTNLVQNAIMHNHRGGVVEVGVDGAGALTVANSGAAVPTEQVPRLFEPFRRSNGERLATTGGVGLGLTIVCAIVSAHGGAIDARPNPGGGLIVRVELPKTRSAERTVTAVRAFRQRPKRERTNSPAGPPFQGWGDAASQDAVQRWDEPLFPDKTWR
jgi:signal transduction histidine kinase